MKKPPIFSYFFSKLGSFGHTSNHRRGYRGVGGRGKTSKRKDARIRKGQRPQVQNEKGLSREQQKGQEEIPPLRTDATGGWGGGRETRGRS